MIFIAGRLWEEKRRERRKARQVEKDSTEIHVLGVSSDKCSPVKSRGGMKDHLIRTWLFTRSLLEEATRILNLYVKGSRRELEERLKERSYRELKSVISGMYSKTNFTKDGKQRNL